MGKPGSYASPAVSLSIAKRLVRRAKLASPMQFERDWTDASAKVAA
jgi:hypothetical protein